LFTESQRIDEAFDPACEKTRRRALHQWEFSLCTAATGLSDIAQLEDGALASYTLRNVSDREVHA
jgi:hypothetical protein